MNWKNLNYNLILRSISFRIAELEKSGKNNSELKELKEEYKNILIIAQQANK